MTVSDRLMKRYINEIYDGDKAALEKDKKADFPKAHFQYMVWLDMLTKNGEITDEQRCKASFGKRP